MRPGVAALARRRAEPLPAATAPAGQQQMAVRDSQPQHHLDVHAVGDLDALERVECPVIGFQMECDLKVGARTSQRLAGMERHTGDGQSQRMRGFTDLGDTPSTPHGVGPPHEPSPTRTHS